MLTLGFDTSNYTTSVAAVDLAGRPVASCRRLLPVPSGERGLRGRDGHRAGRVLDAQMRLALAVFQGREVVLADQLGQSLDVVDLHA